MTMRVRGTARLMAVVAVLAFELAAGRAVLFGPEFLSKDLRGLLDVGPTWVILLVATPLAFDRRGAARPFWFGFLVSGLAASAFVVSALHHPPRESLTVSSSGSQAAVRDPGNLAAQAWWAYGGFTFGLLDRFGYPYLENVKDPRTAATLAAVGLLPQFVVALTGGLLVKRWLRDADGGPHAMPQS